MRFGAARSQIYDAQKTARAKWQIAIEDWDDAIRREHGEQVVDELDNAVSDALHAIDQLTTLFAQIRVECEYGNIY